MYLSVLNAGGHHRANVGHIGHLAGRVDNRAIHGRVRDRTFHVGHARYHAGPPQPGKISVALLIARRNEHVDEVAGFNRNAMPGKGRGAGNSDDRTCIEICRGRPLSFG